MTELSALKKFACPACGAEAQWNAGKQALICPYCSTESPAELSADGRTIQENDLVTALRGLAPNRRGWEAERKSVRCQSCRAISVFAADRVGQQCDFCGSPALLAVTETAAPIKPESQLPFRISDAQVRESVRQWYRTRWFAPNRLKTQAMTDTVKGVYLPYWTFDAQVAADWTADAGYYYYVTETYRDSNGKTRTRQVRHVRWVPADGHVDHFFDDELVPGSKGVDPDLLRRIEPFPTKELVPYDPGYLSGWVVEQYQIDLVAAAQRSREVMDQKLRGLCAKQVPGDTHRNLQVHADYSGQTFKHILVPVWLLTFSYGRKVYQVLTNGYTGSIAGRYPKSWVKILLLILALAAAAAGLYALAR
jgi:Zn finger protein HypA/HybF involved in hydrogenase expression